MQQQNNPFFRETGSHRENAMASNKDLGLDYALALMWVHRHVQKTASTICPAS